MTTEQAEQLQFIYNNIQNNVLTLTSTPVITKSVLSHAAGTGGGAGTTYNATKEGYLVIACYNAGTDAPNTSISVTAGTPTLLHQDTTCSRSKMSVFYTKANCSYKVYTSGYSNEAFNSGYYIVLFPVG